MEKWQAISFGSDLNLALPPCLIHGRRALQVQRAGWKDLLEAGSVRMRQEGSQKSASLHQIWASMMELHENYKNYIEKVVCSCDDGQRQSLWTLLDTRNSNMIPREHHVRFTNDGLMEAPTAGPPHIRKEIEGLIREILERQDEHKCSERA